MLKDLLDLIRSQVHSEIVACLFELVHVQVFTTIVIHDLENALKANEPTNTPLDQSLTELIHCNIDIARSNGEVEATLSLANVL